MMVDVITKCNTIRFDSPNFRSIGELSLPPECSSLSITWGSTIGSLSGIERYPDLIELELHFCSSLYDLTPLSAALATAHIPRLTVSNLGNVSAITNLYGVVIDTLTLKNCPAITDIDGENCSISRIEIINCPILAETPSIALESLTEPAIVREDLE